MADEKLEITRVYKASLDKMWRAWTDPEELKQWHAPEEMTTPDVTVELEVGGAYHIAMKGKEGTHTMRGVLKEIDEPHKLVFSWHWEGSPGPETLVTVEFRRVDDDTTEVALKHELFQEAKERDAHTQGWEGVFNKLETYLA